MGMGFDEERAKKLTESILAKPNSSRAGVVANDLLREHHRGYPLENLRALLSSVDPKVVKLGAFIACELGPKGRPLLPDVMRLIDHPEKSVRFDLIDCVLLWAGPSDKAELASIITLLEDSEPAVRWKAIDFLSRADSTQLEAALAALEASEPNSVNVRGLRWLIGDQASSPEDVKAILQSHDKILRKYGVAAARRMFKISKEPLLYAASINDSDVKNFAESSIA